MDNLQNGIAAFKAGKRDEARKLFIAAMKDEPNNEHVWGWLYQVSNNDNERIQALKKVVGINPNNIQAKQLLDKLIAPPFDEPKIIPPASTTRVQTKNSDPKQQRNLLLTIGALILLCFACVLGVFSSDESSDNNNEKNHTSMAHIQCEDYVKERLKSPASADFPFLDYNVRDLGNNIFEVTSYFDAQNSFGAMLRSNYYCKIQYIGTEKNEDADPMYWILLDLSITQ